MRHLRLVHSNDIRPVDDEVLALLEQGRIIPPLPRVVRARAIARARALLDRLAAPTATRRALRGRAANFT